MARTVACPLALLVWLVVLLSATGALGAGTPTFDWAVSGGGPGSDDADGVGVDARGRSVISGGFARTAAFDAAHSVTSAGGADIFAAGYGKRGRVRWVRRYGAGAADQAYDNDVDAAGHGVITGTFNGTVDFGGPRFASRGGSRPMYGDAFLLKLGVGGRTLWARQIGGAGSDGGDEVAVGPHGNAYVIGDSDGETRIGQVVLPATGGRDAWAARYRRDGSLVWARRLGGPGEQQSHGISADREGHTLVTGEFSGTSLLGSHRLDSAGTRSDAFLAKLDRRGRVRWAQRIGATGADLGRGVDADAKGHVYFTGEYVGTVRIGGTTLTSSGGADMYLAKATKAGRVLWAISVGGPGADSGPELEVDSSGFAYLAGQYSGSARFGAFTLTTPGARGAYVAKVSPRGRVVWVVGSKDSPFATLGELSLGPNSVNVLGRYVSEVTLGSTQLTGAGLTDFFLARVPTTP